MGGKLSDSHVAKYFPPENKGTMLQMVKPSS